MNNSFLSLGRAETGRPARYRQFVWLVFLSSVLAFSCPLAFITLVTRPYVFTTLVVVVCLLLRRLNRTSFRFTLRALLLLTTVLGLGLGNYAKKARNQKLAVTAIKKIGGQYRYYHRAYGDKGLISVPAWVQRYVGEEYLFTVAHVSLVPAEVVSAWNCDIEPVPGEARFSDADLSFLTGLSSLRSLSLEYTNVSDAGLAHIANLRHLESLNL